eukprot:359832-Chlamydomonas_euryale.AAC.7
MAGDCMHGHSSTGAPMQSGWQSRSMQHQIVSKAAADKHAAPGRRRQLLDGSRAAICTQASPKIEQHSGCSHGSVGGTCGNATVGPPAAGVKCRSHAAGSSPALQQATCMPVA